MSGKTDYAGIDYGMGVTNTDQDTGIRYGVIPHHDVGAVWYEESEPDYGPATCPECGAELSNACEVDFGDDDEKEIDEEYYCENCEHGVDSEDAWPDCVEPQYFTHDADGIVACQTGDDTDIFITASPYYTRAQFCSPCAPGACYLRSPCESGPKAYCFPADWFSSDNPCPYPIWRVADNELVYTPPAE